MLEKEFVCKAYHQSSHINFDDCIFFSFDFFLCLKKYFVLCRLEQCIQKVSVKKGVLAVPYCVDDCFLKNV